MPSKSRRAASRQAQVRRRKRRSKAQPQDFDPGPTESARESAVAEPVMDPEVRPEPAMPTADSRQAARPRRRASAGSQSTPAVYRYLGPELRRIGMMAGIIVVILAILTVVLGG